MARKHSLKYELGDHIYNGVLRDCNETAVQAETGGPATPTWVDSILMERAAAVHKELEVPSAADLAKRRSAWMEEVYGFIPAVASG